jgi:hypothetical protein
LTVGGPRHDIAAKRLRNVLRAHVVASDRILEQKISDAGPTNQRIDPHILTEARQKLVFEGAIIQVQRSNVPWYHLASADAEAVKNRLSELEALHRQTRRPQFTVLLGQMLEIAVFRALQSQTLLEYFGHFRDLDAHDDSKPYSKEEPPSWLSGREIPNKKKLDFLIRHPEHGYAGIEIKNIRQWMYPDRDEVRELLFKCCSQDVVPVLICRRIHYSTFSVLNPCGVILHQSFNQLYPKSEQALAEKVKHKLLLGYHDVRVGNEPDARLIRFIHHNLPQVLPTARQRFERFKDLLWGYANGDHSYKSFAARVKRRLHGEPEDLPPFEEPQAPEPPEDFDEMPDDGYE